MARLSKVLAFFREKIGFKRLGLALTVGLVGVAIYVLYHKLKTIDWAKVSEAIGQVSLGTLLVAALFTASAYLILTVYDRVATRAIGRGDVPFRTCALASFTSYSIAHNIGATVFSATVVRYLVYARHGLTAIDAIKLSFIAGLTFWLGNALVLGLGFLLEPEVVAPVTVHVGLGSTMIQLIGATALLALVGWAIFVAKPRAFGKGNWLIRLPGSGTTLAMLGAGLVDILSCGMVFHTVLMAMPQVPDVGFRVVAVIFAASMLLGFAAHTPGAAGPFEASLLIALPAVGFQPESVVAAFILYRLYYFVAPFIIALILLGIREFLAGPGALAHVRESVAAIRDAEASSKAAKGGPAE